jgi:NitT/TauT family transport system ATP-binding protein
VCLAAELRNSDPALDSERISGYLRAFNLDESVLSKYPAELSGGMRQRISIIQSLMADPSILLLDEPFSSLDFYTKLKLETDFRSLVIARGMTAVFVTHDIEEAIAVGDRVVIFGKSPRGIVHDIRIDFADGPRLSPEAVRSHRQFGEYFSEIWGELRDAT